MSDLTWATSGQMSRVISHVVDVIVLVIMYIEPHDKQNIFHDAFATG